MSDHAENSDVLEFGSGANAIDLDAIRARWEAATPGPWEIQGVPTRTFAAALDEWRRSASPEVPSDLDTALLAREGGA